MDNEVHISSLVIQTLPKVFDKVLRYCEDDSLIEIAQTDHSKSKLIVLVEAESTRVISDVLDAVKQLPEVLSASLIYHHVEDPISLKEEMV